MKKLFSVFAATLFAAAMSAGVVTFTGDDFEGQGTANTGSDVSKTKSGVTVSATRAYGAPANTEKGYPAELRVYGANAKEGIVGGVLTISADSKITKIHAEFTDYTKMTFEDQTPYNETWSITADKQIRMTKIEVTIEGEGGGEEGGGDEGIALKFDDGQVITQYFEDYGLVAVSLFNFQDWTEEGYPVGDGDWLDLVIYPESIEQVSGTFTIKDETLDGEESYLMRIVGKDTTEVLFTEASVAIKINSINEEEEMANVTFKGTLKGDDNKTYTVNATLDIYFQLSDEGGEEEGIEAIATEQNENKVIMHEGHIYIIHNGKAYSVTGARVK